MSQKVIEGKNCELDNKTIEQQLVQGMVYLAAETVSVRAEAGPQKCIFVH